MSQIETLANRAFSEGQEEWLEKCDAYNAGRRAIQLADKIKESSFSAVPSVESCLAELREWFPHQWLTIITEQRSSVFTTGAFHLGPPQIRIVIEASGTIIGRGATLEEAMQGVRAWKERQGND